MTKRSTSPRIVRGRYNGTVVVLEEAAPVAHAISVVVEFPASHNQLSQSLSRRFHWDLLSPHADTEIVSVSEELIRQRRTQ